MTAPRADGSAVVVGIDGCRGGWILVERRSEIDRTKNRSTSELAARFESNLSSTFERLRRGDIDAVAIDMPIGLLNRQPRRCDTEARKMLGPRRSSVFPTPVRATLAASDYRHACELSRQVSGKALSKQAFNLLPKIVELDALMTTDEQRKDRQQVVEAHPECAFVRLAGAPLDQPKRTERGRADRLELLASVNPELAALPVAYPRLPVLDLIDAAVLTITANHVVAGSENRLGGSGDVDERGLRAEIVF